MFSLKLQKLLFLKPFISWENWPFQGKGKAIFQGKFLPQKMFREDVSGPFLVVIAAMEKSF